MEYIPNVLNDGESIIEKIMDFIPVLSNVCISKKIKNRLELLQSEINKLKRNAVLNHSLSDDEYNLIISVVHNTISNGTEQRIKRFAKIACDIFYYHRININRSEKYIYFVNEMSEQEIAVLITLYKHIKNTYEQRENLDVRKEYILIPNSKGEYQEFVKMAFSNVGISSSEWFIVLRKLDMLGILQYEDTFITGGRKYFLSDFGIEFIEYLLEINDES